MEIIDSNNLYTEALAIQIARSYKLYLRAQFTEDQALVLVADRFYDGNLLKAAVTVSKLMSDGMMEEE